MYSMNRLTNMGIRTMYVTDVCYVMSLVHRVWGGLPLPHLWIGQI